MDRNMEDIGYYPRHESRREGGSVLTGLAIVGALSLFMGVGSYMIGKTTGKSYQYGNDSSFVVKHHKSMTDAGFMTTALMQLTK